jgi:DNA-binding response OmpR family regulator
VFEAKDGEQGIEAGLRLNPDVVLVDLGLPRADGFEVARRLREPLGDALLVAVTGYGQVEDRRRSTEAGFDVHLVKPVDPSELAKIFGDARRPVRAAGP